MSWSAFAFMLIGVCYVCALPFKAVDRIERKAR